MTSIFESDEQHFEVVVNHENQYSLWPKNWDIPTGWRAVGQSGLKADCLRHIESVWTDLRPRSLVNKMESHGRR
jgi:MbtH protein